MQNMNLNLSESKKKINNNGWQNIGIMYNFIESQNLKAIDVSIFMILVRKSFGYRNTNVSISNKQLADIANCTTKTARESLHRLVDKQLVSRVEWQEYGAKQAYTYRVCFPDKGHISFYEKKSDEEIKREEIAEMHSKLDLL